MTTNFEERMAEDAERREWASDLVYQTIHPVQFNRMTLNHFVNKADEMGLIPVRLVVGRSDLPTVSRLGEREMWLEPDHAEGDPKPVTVVVAAAERIQVIIEKARIFRMEVCVGDLPDDGRWYVEDAAGKRLGSRGC